VSEAPCAPILQQLCGAIERQLRGSLLSYRSIVQAQSSQGSLALLLLLLLLMLHSASSN